MGAGATLGEVIKQVDDSVPGPESPARDALNKSLREIFDEYDANKDGKVGQALSPPLHYLVASPTLTPIWTSCSLLGATPVGHVFSAGSRQACVCLKRSPLVLCSVLRLMVSCWFRS